MTVAAGETLHVPLLVHGLQVVAVHDAPAAPRAPPRRVLATPTARTQHSRTSLLKSKTGVVRRVAGLKGKTGVVRRVAGLKGKTGVMRRVTSLKGKTGVVRRVIGLKGKTGVVRRVTGKEKEVGKKTVRVASVYPLQSSETGRCELHNYLTSQQRSL